MLESQKTGKDKKGVGFDEYRAVPPPPAQVYSTPMPDLSWTGLPEFADNTDIKWNMALLSMRADRLWKKTGKKITIQGFDVAGFDKSKVECFNYHKLGHFARECRAPMSQDRSRRESYKKEPKG
ncbi:ribonuclease H-like domain-containing protein [Tanacetum coccineum]